MADKAPARIWATPAADTYFGPGVINFLNQANRSTLPIVVATPEDFIVVKPTPQFSVAFSGSGASSQRVLQEIAMDLRGGYSIAFRTNDFPPVGITVLAEPGSTPQRIFNSFAGLPPNTPNNAPGLVTDWRSMLLFHEQGHHDVSNAQMGRDRTDRGGPFDELQAERAGIDLYRQALQAGVVRDPGVPDALSAARLIYTMIRPAADKDYAASSMLNTPLRADMDRPGNTGTQSISDTQVGMDKFKRAVYAEAVRMENPQKYDVIRAQAMHDTLGDDEASKPLKDALKQLLDQASKGKWGAAKDLREFISQFPPDNDNVRERMHYLCLVEMGNSMMTSDRKSPYTQHLLNAAVTVRGSSEFANDPVVQTVANSFINAARTYIPGYFKDNAPSSPAAKVGAATPESSQQQLLSTYQDLMARPTVAQITSQDANAPVAVAAAPTEPSLKTQIKPIGQQA